MMSDTNNFSESAFAHDPFIDLYVTDRTGWIYETTATAERCLDCAAQYAHDNRLIRLVMGDGTVWTWRST